MLKNLLAAIGLAVVAKATYAHYREFSALKRAQQARTAPGA